MSDTDRIADYLLDHGSVTSYELSKMGMSGNPSQRIQDIRDKRGWVIDSDRFTRTDAHGTKRPCCRYILRECALDCDAPEAGSNRRDGGGGVVVASTPPATSRNELVKVSATPTSVDRESLDDRGADLGQSPSTPERQRNRQVADVAGESSTSLGDRSSSPDPQDAAVAEPRQVTDADGSPGRDPSASLLLFDMPVDRYADAA